MAEANIRGEGSARFQTATFNVLDFIDENSIRNMASTRVDLNRQIAPEALGDLARIEGVLSLRLVAAAMGRAT